MNQQANCTNGRRPRGGGYRNLWRDRKATRRAEAEARQRKYDASIDANYTALRGTESLDLFLLILSPSQLARLGVADARETGGANG